MHFAFSLSSLIQIDSPYVLHVESNLKMAFSLLNILYRFNKYKRNPFTPNGVFLIILFYKHLYIKKRY